MLEELKLVISLLHHRSGDLEIWSSSVVLYFILHHRSGDLEICVAAQIVSAALHHRSGDLENVKEKYRP